VSGTLPGAQYGLTKISVEINEYWITWRKQEGRDPEGIPVGSVAKYTWELSVVNIY
jgi:hypothetical protein